jgi:hypothetical protein
MPIRRPVCERGAGHIVAMLGRAVDEQRVRAVELFGARVIPILRKAEIA